MRRRAGAMEALTVILLALAAIVLAVLVWLFVSGQTQTQMAVLDFTYEASLVSFGTGCRLTVTVRNTGSVPIQGLTVAANPSLTTPSIGVSPSNPLNPGRSVSASSSTSCGAIGTMYVLEVTASGGGGEVRKSSRVTVS